MTAYTWTIRPDFPNGNPGLQIAHAQFIGSAALANEDVISGLKMPSRARVLRVECSHKGLDTDATATLTFDVGDADDPNRYIDSGAAANSGALSTNVFDVSTVANGAVATGIGYRYGAADLDDQGAAGDIRLTVTAAPTAGGTTPFILLNVFYAVDY